MTVFDYQCQCPCGQTHFSVLKAPKLRLYCHCEICQRVYQQPYSDFTVLPLSHVELPMDDIRFKKLRPPPHLQRGFCQHCDQPVAGIFTLMPGLKFAFIPSANYRVEKGLPESSGHLFYHRRRVPCDDNITKHHGYWRSEWAVTKAVLTHVMMQGRT